MSNLQYVSKLLERAVLDHMHAHLSNHDLYPMQMLQMAATHFFAPATFAIIICFSFLLCLTDTNFRFSTSTFILYSKFYGLPQIVTTADSRMKLANPISTWFKRGHLSIAIALKVDLTIHMDVESNPGPTPSLTEGIFREHDVNPGYRPSRFSTLKMTNCVYYNSQLTTPLAPYILNRNCSCNLHSQGNVRPRKYRRSRAGKLVQEKRMSYSYNIQTLVSHPSSRSKFAYSRKTCNCSKHNKLTIILHKTLGKKKYTDDSPCIFLPSQCSFGKQ